MQQDTLNKAVNAEFYICSKEMDLDKVIKSMNVPTAKTREKNTFQFDEFAMDYWSIDTGYEESDDINTVVYKIKDIVDSKVKEIKMIIDEYHGECGFCIVVKSDNGDLPAIYFEKEFISLASDIGASINMDFI